MNRVEAKELQKNLRPLLIPFSWIYGVLVNIKERYDSKKKKVSFEGVKIVSVGNISVGGVGKTPLVIEISKILMEYGRIGVITGMYPIKDKRVHLVSVDGNIFKKPPKVPDEAYMIARKLPITVISSKSRVAALELAKGLKIDFVILDDALHLVNIKKDLEICVFDKNEPFYKDLYLPAGLIRNSRRLLKNCSFNVCVDKSMRSETAGVKIDCIYAKVVSNGVFNYKGEKVDLNKVSAFIFCGIGNPEGFVETARSVGIDVKGYKFFDDHYLYTKEDIEILKGERERLKADILLTTFKDYVKLEEEDIWYLDIRLEVEGLDEILKGILK